MLDPLDQPLRGRAQDRGGGLGGVPQSLGRLARLVPLDVALGAGRQPVGRRTCAVDAAVGPADQRRQLPARPAAGQPGQRRGGQQPVDGREQRQVAVGVQRGDQRRAGVGLPPGEVPGQPGLRPGRRPARRAASRTAWVNRACRTSRSRASPSTPASHFSSSVSSRVAERSMILPVGLQGAAHPPGRHPHLVHRARSVLAHRGSPPPDGLGLLPQVGQHHLAGRGLAAQPRSRRRRRQPLAEHPRQLRPRVRPADPGVEQPPLHRSSRSGSPCSPSSTSTSRHDIPDVDAPRVCAETWSSTTSTSTRPSSSVNRHRRRVVASSATGPSGSRRGCSARVNATSSAGGVRRRPARASLTRTSSRLSPPDRQLEVPARVVPAPPAAQRHPGLRQAEVVGVEVHRLERLLLGPDRALAPRPAPPSREARRRR